ncbi:Hypothetical protein NTJ_03696 [Nesidiocoris tenuis]|uniref:Uncharacterized protein n=1 Tax=Nesidiocoris tenuis TaxID=355587 RepID=A0ABN7AHX9_9HEMI|nr:Hypothetical protein NTJ_03696 [Nesidiocoris tenuis]
MMRKCPSQQEHQQAYATRPIPSAPVRLSSSFSLTIASSRLFTWSKFCMKRYLSAAKGNVKRWSERDSEPEGERRADRRTEVYCLSEDPCTMAISNACLVSRYFLIVCQFGGAPSL